MDTPTPEHRTDNRCKSCKERLRFEKTEFGKTMPFNADPVLVNGAYEIVEGVAKFVPKDKRDGRVLFVPHFATCTNPDGHRKARR